MEYGFDTLMEALLVVCVGGWVGWWW
jgi:hypothetical protein